MTEATDRLDALRARARQERLVVLVWGPGPPAAGMNSVLYEKRIQTRDHLAREFPNSEFYFSEDHALREALSDLPSVLDEERAQAAIADCIIVFDVARGAHVEVDTFSSVPSIAAKMYVFLPEEYIGRGLAREVHARVAQVLPFSDFDLADCNLCGRAVGIVLTRAIQRFL